MKSILVVDDSPTMRRMVKACLRDLNGVKFDEAGTGLEAIEHLTLSPVALMILDLNMPDMHGLDVLRFVRGHSLYRKVPIIILTTRGDQQSRDAAMAAGASSYLVKPFAPEILASYVRALMDASQEEEIQ